MIEIYNGSRLKLFASPGVTLTAIEAEGTRIKTREYGELLDLESGCWAAVLGHCRKELVQVMCENAGKLFHTHQFFDTEHPGALVKEITAAAELKCSYRGTFTSSGSEAVSLAAALSELITKRHKKLSLSISYLGASPELRMPRNPEYWLDLDVSECLSCSKNSTCRECGKYCSIDFSSIASFVFEPGNSGGLVLFPPEKLIRFLADETRKAGGLVIANEVTTGFGRTGRWFGFQHYEFLNSGEASPDFISMGKGLGNGYPISGLLVRSNLAEILESTGFRYVQSHTDDPLGCIVARKVTEIMTAENLVEHGSRMGEYLRSRLDKIGRETGGLMEVRGRGVMNVAVLRDDYKAKDVFLELLKKGFFVGYSEIYNLIRIYAPLIIQPEEIDALCLSLGNILQDRSI